LQRIIVPGISFLYSTSDPILSDRLEKSLNTVLHDSGYRSELLYSDDSFEIGVSGYSEYPIREFRDERYRLILEGHIYGIDDSLLEADLFRLCRLTMCQEITSSSQIADWLLTHDGDYLIVVVDTKTSQAAIVNDSLGRLPVYWSESQNAVVVSREIGVVISQLRISELDRLALSEQLLFGFCLSDRTPFQGISRLAPSTLLRFGFSENACDSVHVHSLSLDIEPHDLTLSETSARLVELFTDACRKQAASDGNNVLSLSGGLDSRAVAAGLRQAGVDFRAATFQTASGSAAGDAYYASEIAKLLNIDWELIQLPEYRGRDIDVILRQKQGLISVGMAFDVPFMRRLTDSLGRNTIYFSGDGGDKLLPNLVPSRRFTSIRSLAKYTIERNYVMPPAIVARLTRISPTEIIDDLEAVMELYPEESMGKKYVHFMIFERGMKWLFEGEDRNRCSFWSCTPFYSVPFFNLAMSCGRRTKKNHRLYSSFLSALSPELASLPDANRGAAVTSSEYRRKLTTISLLSRSPRIMRWIKSKLHQQKGYAHDSSPVRILRNQFEQCSGLTSYLDEACLADIIQTPELISTEMFDNLLTITTIIEKLSGSCDFLSRYMEDDFV